MTQTRYPQTVVDRFWSKVDRSGDCWLWTGVPNDSGYGRFAIDSRHVVRAHRFAFELENGPIGPGLDICHHCDTPPCVRALHLFAGTAADNMADCRRKDRGNRGERNGNARITRATALEIKQLIAEGVAPKLIAERHGLDIYHVYQIRSGRLWAHAS